MKTTLKWIPCLLLAVAIGAAGCRSQDQAAADNGNSGTLSSSAEKAIGEITVGHLVGADGTIAADQKGNNFTAGQPVFIAFKVGEAPVGTPVTITWIGPDNQPLATDQQVVAKGQSTMSFSAKDTSGWPKGDYNADLSVGGKKVDTERFSIEAAEKAEASATRSKDAISDVTVGHQLGADGGIAAGQEGKNFVPGQPVFIALQTGSAPPGTSIEIAWFGPDNQQLLSDQVQVKPGASKLSFASNQTSGWGLGDYHADLMVNGQKVDTEHFSVVNQNKADKAGK